LLKWTIDGLPAAQKSP